MLDVNREVSDIGTDRGSPGYWRRHARKRKKAATREVPSVAWHAPTGTPRAAGRAGRGGGEARMTGDAG